MASGPPQLQLDLVGLTNLATSIGSRGLKYLATSGVHMHSLGCMLMIAELAPASVHFRHRLDQVRQQERSERFWYFKAVEIGAASNFLVDQLLNTRAGENVLALMTSIAPLVSKLSCTNILLLLFETAGVSHDNTPGIGELGRMREALVSFTRRMDFKEKVSHFQRVIRTFGGIPNPTDFDPYESIPHDKDISSVILMLSKVASEPAYILTYHGIAGAGWTATYASDILGLETCIINATGNSLPISGAYESAKVVIRLSAAPSAQICELSTIGSGIEDSFVVEPTENFVRSGWSIECSKVNFLEANLPQLKESACFDGICEFLAVEILNTLSDAVSSLPYATADSSQEGFSIREMPDGLFHSLQPAALEQLYCQALKILEILGFKSLRKDEFVFEGNKVNPVECSPLCVGYSGAPRLSCPVSEPSLPASFYGKYLARYRFFLGNEFILADKEQTQTTLGHEITLEMFPKMRMEFVMRYLRRRFTQETVQFSGEQIERIAAVLGKVVYLTTWLSLTDWATSIKLLSVQTFYCRFDLGHTDGTYNRISDADHVLSKVVPLCVGAFTSKSLLGPKLNIKGSNWIVLDLDGLIVIRSEAIYRKITEFQGCRLELRSGRINYKGAELKRVRFDSSNVFSIDFQKLQWAKTTIDYPDFLVECKTSVLVSKSPRIACEKIQLRQTWSQEEDHLFLRLECRIPNNNAWVSLDLTGISERIYQILSMKPCGHNDDRPVHFRQLGWEIPRIRQPSLLLIDAGLKEYTVLTRKEDLFNSKIFYSPFETDTDDVWLMHALLQVSDNSQPCSCILQKQTCLRCTFHYADQCSKGPLEKWGAQKVPPLRSWQKCVYVLPFKSEEANAVEEKATLASDTQYCEYFPKEDISGERGCEASSHTPCCLYERPNNPEVKYEPCMACKPLLCNPFGGDTCEYCKELFAKNKNAKSLAAKEFRRSRPSLLYPKIPSRLQSKTEYSAK